MVLNLFQQRFQPLFWFDWSKLVGHGLFFFAGNPVVDISISTASWSETIAARWESKDRHWPGMQQATDLFSARFSGARSGLRLVVPQTYHVLAFWQFNLLWEMQLNDQQTPFFALLVWKKPSHTIICIYIYHIHISIYIYTFISP